MDNSIKPLNAEVDAAIAADAAALHRTLISHSPVVLLGDTFLREFYYGELPRLNLTAGAVAYVDGKPVGFIFSTTDSEGFMGIAMKRRFFRLCWIMLRTLITRPASIVQIFEAMKIMAARKDEGHDEPIAELLSFGVLPENRNRKFIKTTGLRISLDLLNSAKEQLKQQGATSVIALVDKTNTDVKLFYRSLDWQLSNDDVGGWRVPQVEFKTAL